MFIKFTKLETIQQVWIIVIFSIIIAFQFVGRKIEKHGHIFYRGGAALGLWLFVLSQFVHPGFFESYSYFSFYMISILIIIITLVLHNRAN